MKSPHRRDADQDEPGMTSMIDVVFLLLVFFVWTSSFDEPERDITSRIAMSERASQAVAGQDAAPTPSFDPADQEPRSEEVVVRLIAGPDGLRYQIGSVDAAAVSEVFSKLKKIAELPINTIVIVDPDDDVEFADCIHVYDYALLVGFNRVLFAVD